MVKNFHFTTVVFFCLFLQLLVLPGCKKTDDIKASSVKPEVELFDALIDTLTGSRTVRLKVVRLSSDTVYILTGSNFVREAGEQLIIDEGVLVKVNIQAAGGGGSIQIKPGGIITAKGSSKYPIVFTSNQKPGIQGINWGGIILQGKSFNNTIGSSGDAADFSGVLQYVRIEFAPLILDAVGNKTVIENVMVSYVKKEKYDQYQNAFNIYGGTFNARNIISYACGGPADFMITNGYTGNIQNIIACRHPFFGQSGFGQDNGNSLAGIFIQNNVADPINAKPFTNPVISNLTVLGPDAQSGTPDEYADTNLLAAAIVTTKYSCFQIRNSIFLGYPAGGWFLNDSLIADNLIKKIDELNYSIVHSNIPQRIFYLAPGTSSIYNSADFRNYILGPLYKNRSFNNSADFMLQDIVNFDDGPNLLPESGSPLLSGADFSGSDYFSNNFFNKQVTYVGALGTEDWLKDWSNFKPLKTNYNFPQ